MEAEMNSELITDKMNDAIDQINLKINHICTSLNVRFDNFEIWLQQHRSKLYDDLNRMFEAINTDIQGRSLNNDVDEFELKAWEKKVEEWRDRYVELLDEFWEGHAMMG